MANKRKSLNEQGCRKVSHPVANVAHTDTDTDTKKSSSFDQFWHWWPNKQKKKDALKIWKRDKLDRYAPQIIEHVRLRPSLDPKWKPNARGETFILLPTTFLNGECWNDEFEAAITHKPRKPEVPTEAELAADRLKADAELAALKDRR